MISEKIYKEFNIGDEVFTEKETWKCISANTPYIVLACYKPPGYIERCLIKVIEIKNDKGIISRYATDKFHKTNTQIREDKLNEILKHI